MILKNNLSYNQISDLSPLTFLPNLEVLDLESNHIESGEFSVDFLTVWPTTNYTRTVSIKSGLGSPVLVLLILSYILKWVLRV